MFRSVPGCFGVFRGAPGIPGLSPCRFNQRVAPANIWPKEHAILPNERRHIDKFTLYATKKTSNTNFKRENQQQSKGRRQTCKFSYVFQRMEALGCNTTMISLTLPQICRSSSSTSAAQSKSSSPIGEKNLR